MQNSIVSQQEAAIELLKRRKARKNLLAFTEYTKPDFQKAKHHELITSKLEEVEEKVQKGEGARLMIFTPPRHTKSELASRRFPAWVLGRNPNWQIITATYSGDFAADFGRDVRNIVSSDQYNKLFPEVSLRPDSKAANRWHTDNGGVYVSAGAGGPLTGRGGHIILIDDPFKDWQEAYSEAIREARWNWYLTVVRTRLMPGAALVLIMTRWHDDDIAGRLVKQQDEGGDQWDIVSLPALAEENDPLERKPGEPLWPEWFSKDDLEQTRRILPSYEWSALYQQNPMPDEGSYFKADWFRYYDKPSKYLNIYITHDDAVTEDGDYTEIGVWGVDANNNILAIDWWTGQTSPDVWIDELVSLIKLHKPLFVVGESGPIRRSVEPFLIKRMQEREIYGTLKWLPSITDKPTRALSFRAMCSMGKVYFPKKQWATDVINQLLRFPAGVHDDKVDTCSLLGRVLDKTWNAKLPSIKPKPKTIETEKIRIKDVMNEMINKPRERERL